MAKSIATEYPAVRRATEADLPTLVELNAEAQDLKRRAEPRFWTPHPEAPARFGAWMRTSLGLPDRDLFVAGDGSGFAVLQPGALPAAHPAGGLGLPDDFHVRDWNGAAHELLGQTEAANAARGRNALLAVSPAAWTAKRDFLAVQGYRTALRWWLKG